MWTDTTMDKPSMSKAKVGNNYATLHNTNSLLGLTNPIEVWNIWLNRSDSAIFLVYPSYGLKCRTERNQS